jgi:hypothetical protein
MSDENNFNISITDEKLSEAFDKAGLRDLEKQRKIKDNISNDIKSLENYLQNFLSSGDFIYPIKKGEFIKWNQSSKRLTYIDDEIDKPLIECKFEVRYKVSAHMPGFVLALGKSIKMNEGKHE